jgi:hypothetical protein
MEYPVISIKESGISQGIHPPSTQVGGPERQEALDLEGELEGVLKVLE